MSTKQLTVVEFNAIKRRLYNIDREMSRMLVDIEELASDIHVIKHTLLVPRGKQLGT